MSNDGREASSSSAAPQTRWTLLHKLLTSPKASPQPLHFGQSIGRFELPFPCHDLALTSGGQFLMAAGEHGMLEYSKTGSQLTSWRPPARTDCRPDAVELVAAACDGRAVVGVFHARLLLLLSRKSGAVAVGNGASATEWWSVDRRIGELQAPPSCLSVFGDLVAATEKKCLNDEHQRLPASVDAAATTSHPSSSRWAPGPIVCLFSMGSGQPLNTPRRRPYDVAVLALASNAIITASNDRLVMEGGRESWVVEAYSCSVGERASKSERLWRWAVGQWTCVHCACVDASGHVLYLSLGSLGENGYDRVVAAFSAADGTELIADAARFGDHLLPVRLAMGTAARGQILLASLCSRPLTQYALTVAVHVASHA